MNNFLRRFSALRHVEEMEKKIATKERINAGLEQAIVNKSSAIKLAAIQLEATAEEVLTSYDKYRG